MRVSNLTDADLRRIAADHRKLADWPTSKTQLFTATQTALAEAFEELLAYRQAEASEERKLALSLAFEYAESLIDSSCNFADDDDFWNDLDTADDDAEALPDAVKHLESRGLLQRHETNPNWVMVRDESEATA